MENHPYVAALSAEQQVRIARLVEEGLSIEQRWLEYSKLFGDSAAGGDPIERAKEAVAERYEQLHKLICEDKELGRVAASPQTGVVLSLAFMVTGKLVASKFHDVDVVQLGVLIAQSGLLAFCQKYL